jgi:hypothetical protein
MLFTAAAAKRKPTAAAGVQELEPSLFRRKMEAANMLPAAPAADTPSARSSATVSRIPAPSVRQYLFNLTGDARRLTESEVRNAVVGVTPLEVERVARAVARLRGRYLAQVVDIGAAAQGPLTRGEIEQLRAARENYEEMEAGFTALRGAIEAGEVPLEGIRRD